MRRRSKARQAEIDSLPAIRSIDEDRQAVLGSSDQSFREFVRRLPCVVCLRATLGGDPCHRLGRRHGDWVDVDGSVVGNIFPACRDHHEEQHRGIVSFQERHGLDLEDIARVIGDAYLAGWSADGLSVTATRVGGYRIDGLEPVDGGVPY